MSELNLFKWDKAKTATLINSVPLITPVFVYGKSTANPDNFLDDYDIPNEFFVKRMLGLDEEEQFYEDTQGYLHGIDKYKVDSITNKRIAEIKTLNQEIIEFILKNLHKLYWRDYANGVISTINPNRALDLIVPAAVGYLRITMPEPPAAEVPVKPVLLL